MLFDYACLPLNKLHFTKHHYYTVTLQCSLWCHIFLLLGWLCSDCFCDAPLTHKSPLGLTRLFLPHSVLPPFLSFLSCILGLGYLYIFGGRGSFIWFFTLAKFLLNPQAFSAGADPRSRWTVWMVSHLWGLWPLPPSAPCVVPNYSWIPFNKRQAGRQASRHHLPTPPSHLLLLLLSSLQEKKYKWMQLKFTHLFCTL